MYDKAEIAFRSFISCLQIAKLYGSEHLKYKKFLDKAYDDIREVLNERGELIIGIIGDEIAFDKEILLELSSSVKPMIHYLKSRGIEKISISRGMSKEELNAFINYLMSAPKEEEGKEAPVELPGVRNISAGRIKISQGEAQDPQKGGLETAVNYLNLYNSSLDNVSSSIEDVLNARSLDNLDLRFNVTSIFENLLLRHQELLKLAVVKRYDVSTFSHILNVSILSMFFSSKLGLSKDEVLEIGIAALFHDIGKMYISRKIIKKSERLTDEEFDSIKSHSAQGAQLLIDYADTLGMLPAVVAFEHHLRADGKGYPRLSVPFAPHLASCIVALCDVYEALSQRRSYKTSYPPNVIYSIMSREKEKYFEPRLLDIFFTVVGVWPIGTIVTLSDRSIAVVREENEDNIFSPLVEVVSGGQRQVIDLRDEELQLRIERSLDPQTEGKDYAALV